MTPGGNTERFERLFSDHIDAVLAYALARVDPETAKDAVADTFLVAWRRLEDVPDSARAWLLGVTRRTLSGQRRSLRRQHRIVERIIRTGTGSGVTHESGDIVTDGFTASAALRRLRDADRELLCLIAWDGLDHSEAAEVLGCSPGTFAVRLHRARGRLEAALTTEERLGQDRDDSKQHVHDGDTTGTPTQEVPRDDS